MEIANSTPLQRELLTKLQSENRNLRFAWDAARGALSFVRSDSLAKVQPRESGDSERSRSDSLSAFLEENGALFGLTGNSRTLRLLRTGKDDLGFFHHEYQQFAETNDGNGVPASIEVHGARLGAHFAPDGELVIVLSSCYPDIRPANSIKTTAAALRAGVRESVEPLDGFHELEARMTEREKLFPLTHEPRLVIHPWRGKPIYCWATYGYGPVPKKETGNRARAIGLIVFGQMFFNAETGALFLFAPMQSGAENPVVGNGLSSIPVGGPFTSRPLQVVRIDAGPTHRLKDTTRARAIVTYDAHADILFADPPFFIVAGAIPVSENMGANWNGVAASTTDADRTASQQPEVDGHATCGELYDWYFAIGCHVGWDNNRYPTKPPQTINFVAHAFDASLGTSRSANSRFDLKQIGGEFIGCIVCFDGDPTAVTQNGVACDYVAGSRALVAHEYQHGVTHFSVDNVAGNPGGVPIQSETSPAGTPLAGWGGAVHEGLSDVFAGLFSGDWWMGGEISSTGRLWRNLAFPRDPTPLSAGKADHWDDRDIDAAGPNPDAGYFRGCILAHAAYLMAQGGVHQRSSRTPALIPVRGLGREVAGGQSVYKAARFWYRTVAYYLPIIGPFSGTSTLDEEKFRRIRNDCVNAAVDLYGLGSAEHKTAVLAWYAVGLQPAGTSYGADVTFLTWGADWWRSRPYVGVPSPDWSAPDLFINNGGISEWNALINVVNGGAATQFQNDVFARVRNIGDQQADDVVVHFEYTKITSSGAAAAWQPMVDKNGNVQALNIGILGAGQSNFPDSAQNAPPAAAGVKWWIPPLLAGEVLDHFCIRARVVSSNDVNEFNNEVQSNIAFSNYVPGAHLRFLVSNSRSEPMKVELALSHTLPYDWKVDFAEPTDKLVLKPWETRSLEVEVGIPDSLPTHLTAPLNGRIIGSLEGDLSAKFTGTLHRSRLEGKRLVAEVGLNLNDGDHVSGRFDGRFDAGTAAFDGEVTGTIQRKKPSGASAVKLLAKGWLRPDRMINIAQVEEGIPVGGVSFQIQVPLPKETPFGKLPPTGTKIEPGKTAEGHGSGAAKLG